MISKSLQRRQFFGKKDTGPNYARMYLTFKALESGTFTYTRGGDNGDGNTYYSLDSGVTWTACATEGATTTSTVSEGDEVLWKSSGITPKSTTGGHIGNFSSSGEFEVYGNVMSMQNGDNFAGVTNVAQQYQFARLFYNATHLISCENLVMPSGTLTNRCCYNMFYGCSSLTTPPALPSTSLYNYCYNNMFRGCTSLTTAPDLNATTLSSYCYQYMFRGCSNLTYIKCLATSISATNCLSDWVRDVAASGTFVKDSTMSSWPSGNSGIPENWTIENA